MSIEDKPLTIDVPTAGKRYFGISRSASYDAAARGEIPTIRVGRLLRVPIAAMERLLERPSRPGRRREHEKPGHDFCCRAGQDWRKGNK